MSLENIKYCCHCLMPDSRPRVFFNKNGVCNACMNMEEKKKNRLG